MRKVFAAILDFLTVFIGGGMLIGNLTGGATDTGFKLDGWPALLLFTLVIAYFVIGAKTGGTIWQRILNVKKKSAAPDSGM